MQLIYFLPLFFLYNAGFLGTWADAERFRAVALFTYIGHLSKQSSQLQIAAKRNFHFPSLLCSSGRFHKFSLWNMMTLPDPNAWKASQKRKRTRARFHTSSDEATYFRHLAIGLFVFIHIAHERAEDDGLGMRTILNTVRNDAP